MVVYIHAAPPCGPCSRARNRRIPFHLRSQGAPDPKPLRSERWPQGLQELLELDAERVATANAIYQNVCKIVKHFASSALISIENPSRSYMWLTSWFQSLISECNLTPVHFQQRMHGGQRDKWSCFYVNHTLFQELALTCDRSHEHLPWVVAQEEDKWVFSTAQEAEYPELLCQRISSIVATVCQQRGVVFLQSKPRQPNFQAKIRAAEAGHSRIFARPDRANQ